MKKLMLSIVFLLFLVNASAQNFEINLISYEPETGNARIAITNTASTDFHDLKIKIDNIAEIKITDVLTAGISIATFQTISPGEHEITLTTKEGITFTKNLYFSPSEKQIEQQVKKQKQDLEQQTQQNIVSKTPKSNKYIYLILAIIAIVIFYIIYRRLK